MTREDHIHEANLHRVHADQFGATTAGIWHSLMSVSHELVAARLFVDPLSDPVGRGEL